MANLIITSDAVSIKIDLGVLATDRKYARISIADIRSVVKTNDESNIEIVFSNGEIQKIPYQNVDSIDGDAVITSQAILFDKVSFIKFGA